MSVGPDSVVVSVLPASQANSEIIEVARRLARAADATSDPGARQEMLRAAQDLLKASGELTGVLEVFGKAARAR